MSKDASRETCNYKLQCNKTRNKQCPLLACKSCCLESGRECKAHRTTVKLSTPKHPPTSLPSQPSPQAFTSNGTDELRPAPSDGCFQTTSQDPGSFNRYILKLSPFYGFAMLTCLLASFELAPPAQVWTPPILRQRMSPYQISSRNSVAEKYQERILSRKPSHSKQTFTLLLDVHVCDSLLTL